MNATDFNCEHGCRWSAKYALLFAKWLCDVDARTWVPITSGKSGSVCICRYCLTNYGNKVLKDRGLDPIVPDCVRDASKDIKWEFEGRQLLMDFKVALEIEK